jgi:hypothetical protein
MALLLCARENGAKPVSVKFLLRTDRAKLRKQVAAGRKVRNLTLHSFA